MHNFSDELDEIYNSFFGNEAEGNMNGNSLTQINNYNNNNFNNFNTFPNFQNSNNDISMMKISKLQEENRRLLNKIINIENQIDQLKPYVEYYEESKEKCSKLKKELDLKIKLCDDLNDKYKRTFNKYNKLEKELKDKKMKIKAENERKNDVIKSQKLDLENSLDILSQDFLKTIKFELSFEPNKNIINLVDKFIKSLFIKDKSLHINISNNIKNYINAENLKGNGYSKLTHINILILGPTGVGKSTLLNNTLKLQESEGAKESIGEVGTIGPPKGYESKKEPYLRIYDSEGFTADGSYDTKINSLINFIKEPIEKGNFDKIIHCIWYCVNNRFNEPEIISLKNMRNIYSDDCLPIIIVITQCYDEEDANKMKNSIKQILEEKKLIADIRGVVAKDKIVKLNRKSNNLDDDDFFDSDKEENEEENNIVFKKKGINSLILCTKDKILKSLNSACFTSFIEKLKIKNKENIKNLSLKINEKIKTYIKNKIFNSSNIILNNKIFDKIKKLIQITLKLFFEEINVENDEIDYLIRQFLNDIIDIFKREFKILFDSFLDDKSNDLAIMQLNLQTNKIRTFKENSNDNIKSKEVFLDNNRKLIFQRKCEEFKIKYFFDFIDKIFDILVEKIEGFVVGEIDINFEKNEGIKDLMIKKIQSVIKDFINNIYQKHA